MPLLIIEMIGVNDCSPLRLCGVRDVCILCYGNSVNSIINFLTALFYIFWHFSATTTKKCLDRDFDGNIQRKTWQTLYWMLLIMAFRPLKPLIDGECLGAL